MPQWDANERKYSLSLSILSEMRFVSIISIPNCKYADEMRSLLESSRWYHSDPGNRVVTICLQAWNNIIEYYYSRCVSLLLFTTMDQRRCCFARGHLSFEDRNKNSNISNSSVSLLFQNADFPDDSFRW